MNDLIQILDGLGEATLGAFWIPVLLWTAGSVLVFVALRAGRQWHPAVQYRLAQATLLSLPLGVLLAAGLRFEPLETVTAVVPALPIAALGATGVEVAATTTEIGAQSIPPTFLTVVGLITVLALAASGIALVRLLGDTISHARLRRSVKRVPAESSRRVGMRRVSIHLSDELPVPMMFGWIRPRIGLPASLSEGEKALAIEHELIHIRQGDYPLAWIERLVGVAFAFHPAVHRLRTKCSLLREMGCDAAMIDERRAEPADYARLLLRFSGADGLQRHLPIAMADTSSNIQQRIRAMSPLTAYTFGRAARWGLATLALVALVSTMVVPRAVTASTGPDGRGSVAASDTLVYAEQMPEPIGGLEGIQNRVLYDAEAREEGIEGTLFLQFVVGADGVPGDIIVVRGLDPRLDRAAVEALEQTRFTPARQGSEAVAVRMTLPVRFDDQPAPPTPPQAPPPEEGVYVVVEQMPEPIGGLEAIQERVEYPEAAMEAGIEGRVFLQFIVDVEGNPRDIIVVRGVGGGLDEAAVEALRQSRFTPGRQRGEAVEVRMSIPVMFRLPGARNG